MTRETGKQTLEEMNSGEETMDILAGCAVKVKFEIYGEDMIEKKVKSISNSGRVYRPPHWIGSQVKIIQLD